jgi:hypothetical protein
MASPWLPRIAPALAPLKVCIPIASCAFALNSSYASAAEQGGRTDSTADVATADSAKSAALAECVEAHASGQEMRQAGQLLRSREEFLRCSQGDCPELVRTECLNLADELRSQIPTVVFRMTVDGVQRSDVQVTMDGKTLFSEVPTTAFELDPGRHHFTFRHGELGRVERRLTITAGEKLVAIVVQFTTHATSEEPPAPGESTPPVVERRPVPVPVYLLSGIGVLGLGGFIGFGLATRSKENELRSTCSPACAQAEIDSLNRRATMADVSLGVGAVAFAAAVTYYLLRPTETVQAGVAVLPNGHIQSQLRVEF